MFKLASVLSHALTALLVLGMTSLAIAQGAGTKVVILGSSGGAAVVSSTGSLGVENGPYSVTRVTADGQIKATAGFVHTVCVMPTTATPTAGLMSLYNSASETGTVVYSKWFFATDTGRCDVLDATMGTGIYVSYDATLANASVTVTFR